jgi:hypothetical protein
VTSQGIPGAGASGRPVGESLGPLFFEVPMREAVSLADLRPDGIAKSRQAPIPLKVDRVMAGGQEVEFLQPVYPGDTLTAETRLADRETSSQPNHRT